MNNSAVKQPRRMIKKETGEVDKSLLRRLKRQHLSMPWYSRYVRDKG